MAKILITDKYLILATKNGISAYDIKNPDKVHVLTTNEASCATPQESTHIAGPAEFQNVLCITICKCGAHLAATNDQKQLLVWNVTQDFTPIYNRKLARKCLSLTFLKDCSRILVADKTGDVIRYDLHSGDETNKGELILGHLSTILDIVLSHEDRYVVTCDRDEKIRVSSYPNCYDIEAFCLGHSEFVIKLAFLPEDCDILVSGSGDGTLKFWKFEDGVEVGSVRCRHHLPKDSLAMLSDEDDETKSVKSGNARVERNGPKLAIKKFVCSQNIIAVTYYKLPLIGVYQADVGISDRKVTCDHKSHLTLASEPHDILFDGHHRLWVTSPAPEQFLKVFRFENQQPVLLNDTTELSVLIQHLNTNSSLCQGSADIPSIIPSLYKQWYDNVSQYLDAKEERLRQKDCKEAKRQVTSDTTNKRRKTVPCNRD